jgi:hypothetical protein
MVAMRVLKAAIDDVVDVVAMRNSFMAAARTMDMPRLAGTSVIRRAPIWIALADLDYMLIEALSMRMLKMPVGQIVEMAIVADRGVAAARPVPMRLGMRGLIWHYRSLRGSACS